MESRDGSSDVCSSDLTAAVLRAVGTKPEERHEFIPVAIGVLITDEQALSRGVGAGSS